MHSSKLRFGLYSVDERLWDDVLGWAAVNRCVEDDTWLRDQLPSIDTYLLGATSFHYPSILRDGFSRLAMHEALAAGVSGEAFPTQRIAEVARLHASRTSAGGTGRSPGRALPRSASGSRTPMRACS